MPETKITYKLDMERLLQNNPRALIKRLLREEFNRHTTTVETFGRKEVHHA